MSDSPDEFASYDPTTPYKPPPTKNAATRPARANNRPVAGPSSKPATGAAASRKNANSRQEDTEQIVIASSSEDEAHGMQEEGVAAPVPRKSRTARKTTGGPARAKGKGKAKAEPPQKAARNAVVADDPMDVDEQQVIEVEEDEVVPPKAAHSRNNIKVGKSNTSVQRSQQEESNVRELQHVRKQLETVMTERDRLSKQLEELFQIRHTEAEEVLEQFAQQYEERVKTQETLIHELTSQLANVKALAGSEKSYMLHFLTREAADEEKKVVENEVSRWKDMVKQRDEQLAAKDKRIAEMEAQEMVLRSDLHAEIERGKSLAARNPQPTIARSHVRPTDDLKNAEIVKLYEDMTNLLVIGVKFEKSPYMNVDEPLFTCVFTHHAQADGGQRDGTSLNFSLRNTLELPEGVDPDTAITSKNQLENKVRYQPLELDKESDEFVQSLDFFNNPFMFPHEQLPVFLKTLTDRLGKEREGAEEKDELANNDGDDDDNDDDVQIIAVGP